MRLRPVSLEASNSFALKCTDLLAIVYIIGPDDCDFDFGDGFCSWAKSNDNDDKFEWLIGSGATPSSSTGPSADHTSGAGTKFLTGSAS